MNRTFTKFKTLCSLQKFSRFLLVIIVIGTPLLASAQFTISGIIRDAETKEPISGAAVLIKGTNTGMATDENGQYSIQANTNDVIEFSLLGYKSQEYKVPSNPASMVNIALELDAVSLEGVIVESGIIQRDKLGFTGSYTTVTKDDIKRVGGYNVLENLKSLDPGFIVTDNNLLGSDPNALANIEVRGTTSMNITSVQDEASATAESNQPLFILDGFEATLQEIKDLDINRVESITILKDAGSTAIFGAKGANGVIVVETIKPKRGEFFITYNGDFTGALPDLSEYNMMNAAEKLEFERLSLRYGDLSYNTEAQKEYYRRLEKVKSGVDTYWLSEPVRFGLTNGHSLTVASGLNDLQVIASANYRNIQGVMKGSDRETYGGSLKLSYRGFDGLNIQNSMSVTGTNAAKGSWGKFSDFVNANPYFEKRNADGSIPKYLDKSRTEDGNTVFTSVNPLYNASLNSRDDTKIFTFTNNTSIDWNVNKALRLKADLSLKHNTSNNVVFDSPQHSKFDNVDYTRKGTYKSKYERSWSYKANASASYLKSFDLHNLTMIVRGNIEDTQLTEEAFDAIGFPIGSIGYPSQAFSYQYNNRPDYESTIKRSIGLIGAFNYNYDYRYLLDINYNLEGATTFGRNKRFQNFWSVGVGWNMHREAFAEDWEWLKELKLRGSYGTNGNQNVNVVTSSVYSYYVGNNIFGQSSYLSKVGNPNLNWQVVKKLSAGIDFSIWRLKLTFDVYNHKTDPQIVSLSQKPSTGVKNYSTNLGYLKTTGLEFKLFYNVVNIPENNFLVNLSFSGAHNKAEYGGFQDALDNLNEAYRDQDGANYSLQSLQRYEDGRSPHDLWAMQSLGIDPATGREIFLTKDGKQTFHYNYEDRIVIANSRPKLEGTFGVTVGYKKLQVNAFVRYRVGSYTYNTDLFNKVENITMSQVIYNQDKRALYDRWQNPGDIAEFKGISLNDNQRTPVSSRFIQKNNLIRGESFKVMWNFTGDKWLETLRLKDCTVSLSVNDFFNLSSIKLERSTDYPFQRSMTLNISARF